MVGGPITLGDRTPVLGQQGGLEVLRDDLGFSWERRPSQAPPPGRGEGVPGPIPHGRLPPACQPEQTLGTLGCLRREGPPPLPPHQGAGGAVRRVGGRGPATAVHSLKLFYNIAGAFKIIPFLQNIPG